MVVTVNDKMTAIADNIRAKTEKTDLLGLDEMAESINEVFEIGQKGEYDRFWDNFQNYGKRGIYNQAFYCVSADGGWNDDIYNPKYDIVIAKDSYSNNIFAGSTITDSKVTIDASKAASINGIFNSCKQLKTVRSLIVGRNVVLANSFIYCDSLQNFAISGEIGVDNVNFQWSPLLTHESLMNIINCLVDYSGTDTWKTITLGATNLAKLTADELAIMTSKQWNYI